MNFRHLRCSCAVLLALVAGCAVGCDTYYIPPPPVAISLQAYVSTLVITTIDSSGDITPSTTVLTGSVSNATNLGINYSVGQNGSYVQGGDAQLGFINSAGVYTAPSVLPNPNEVTILAVPVADLTQSATAVLTLENPNAVISSVTPDLVVAGHSYTLNVTGTYFEPGATLTINGLQAGPALASGVTSLQIPITVNSTGLLTVAVNNPYPVGATNPFPVRSLPAAPSSASSVAVVVDKVGTDINGNPVIGTKAFIPQTGSLSVVDLDSNQQVGSVVLPSGYVPTIAAPNPFENEAVIGSATSNLIQVIDTTDDTVVQTWPLAAVTASTLVNGYACEVCGLLVDGARDNAIASTSAGFIVLNLATGAASAPFASPADADFAYDYTTQRIYAPYAGSGGSGVNLIDLVAQTVSPVQLSGSASYGTGSDAGLYDTSTGLLVVGDTNTGQTLSLNFNSQTTNSSGTSVPAGQFTVTSGCAGSWDGGNIDPDTHVGWFANLGACVAVVGLPQSPVTGPPQPPSSIQWAQVPLSPDGLAWLNSPLGPPQSATVYTGPDGLAYGLAVRQDGAMLLKMGLAMMQAANPIAGAADANQVDPTNVTVNGATVSALVFIPIH